MPFAISDPPNSDLCWAEYEFIAAQKHPMEWIKELEKLSRKTLTVEISPGATCQLRLSEAAGNDSRLDKSAAAKKRAQANKKTRY
jgi:hypothetical protein